MRRAARLDEGARAREVRTGALVNVRRAGRRSRSGRRVREGAADFLTGVEHVAAALRSGAAPERAWGNGLGVCVESGVPRWTPLLERAPDEGAARAVRAAAELSADLGAAPATALHRIAIGLAHDADAAAQRDAALAGPRATARLLAWLPLTGILLGLILGADPVAVLLDGRGGSALLCGGALLSAVGRWWTGRCITAAVEAGAPVVGGGPAAAGAPGASGGLTARGARTPGGRARRRPGLRLSSATSRRVARLTVHGPAPRGGRSGGDPRATAEPDPAVVLDLLEVACGAGASVPGALAAVGRAVGGSSGTALVRAAQSLGIGAGWDEAWDGSPVALAPVSEALRRSWVDGAPPADALRTAAEVLRRSRHSRGIEAAERLAVRLVLPLGTCYLPAFVLVGLVPLLISMARGALGA